MDNASTHNTREGEQIMAGNKVRCLHTGKVGTAVAEDPPGTVHIDWDVGRPHRSYLDVANLEFLPDEVRNT